jgi:hypothetical protein
MIVGASNVAISSRPPTASLTHNFDVILVVLLFLLPKSFGILLPILIVVSSELLSVSFLVLPLPSAAILKVLLAITVGTLNVISTISLVMLALILAVSLRV